MATAPSNTVQQNRLASGSMLVSVLCYSFVPLLLVIAEGARDPFIFNAVYRFGAVGGALVLLVMFYRDFLLDPRIRSMVSKRVQDKTILLLILPYFGYTAFTWSVKFIDVSLTTIAQEIWPALFILFTERLLRKEQRFSRPSYTQFLLIIFSFVGFAFVIYSQTDGFGDLDVLNRHTLIGVSLAVLAALIISSTSYNFRWAADLKNEITARIQDTHISRSDDYRIELFCLMVPFVIGSLASAVVNFGAGIVTNRGVAIEWLSLQSILISAVIGGALLDALGTVFNRTANLKTSNLGINAFGYATPLFGLLWLYQFSDVGVVRIDYLVIGAVAIISTNLLINFEAEVRFGFKALILALWTCGTFVYVRDEMLLFLPFDNWLWPRETYLGALGLSATVFILLLTFRVARLGPRTQGEDNRIFALHRNLEMLARRNLIDGSVSEHIRGIDSAHNPEELRAAYTRAKLCFAQAAAVDHPLADRKLLADAEAQMNMVTNSRQQGVDFGELFSLIIFGGSTIALAMLSRPAVDGWVAFLYEVFSVLFSAVVVFLIINVWDLHRERADLVLANRQDSREYGVIFRDPKNRRFEQSVSVVIGLLIILAYAGLLWNKWLG